MRPSIIAWLAARHLDGLATLVPTSGILYSVAVAALVALFVLRLRTHGVSWRGGVDAALAGGFGALIGTRTFRLVTDGGLLTVPPTEWFDWSYGTASWGAYLGALLGLLGYLAITRQRRWLLLDTAASCAALGPVIGRFACLLAGDDFGRPTSLPWALTFPGGSLAYDAHASAGLIPPDAAASLPVHPFQLYLAANGLLVFLVVSRVWRRAGDRPGATLAAYLTGYGASRFGWEFLRDPAAGGAAAGLSVSQVMCLGFVVAGVLLLRRRTPGL
jgi:phosphatidylglycerol:prolipoprotein diacylglycerol transferase